MKRLLALICLLGWALAQPLTPQDFAAGVPVTPSGSDAVQYLELPDALYEGVLRPDLGDIRVFNAEGEVVPYARLGLETRQVTEALELPLYPLTGDSLPAGLSVQIAQGETGTQVDIDTQAPLDEATTYLIDARALDAASASLRFTWEDDMPFVSDVLLLTSDDLTNWSQAREVGALAGLRQGEFALKKDRLELRALADYLWLQPAAGERLPLLTGVTARVQRDAEQPVKWHEAELISSDEAYIFDAGGFYPVGALRLSSSPNVLAQVTLLSAHRLEEGWTRQFSGLFFDLTREGERLRSSDWEVNTRDRYWRLEVDPAGGGFGGTPPGLELGLRPETLAFVARGGAPFTLAYGSAKAAPQNFDAEGLLTRPDQLPPLAQVGAPFELAGSAALSEQTSFPWQQVLLWSVLVGGAGLLAFLAWQLLKQANQSSP